MPQAYRQFILHDGAANYWIQQVRRLGASIHSRTLLREIALSGRYDGIVPILGELVAELNPEVKLRFSRTAFYPRDNIG